MEVDYFAQDQYKALDPNARLIDDIASVAPTAMSGQTQLRTLLGCFLFTDDEVFKTIGVLSGGERNRYALARMLLEPSNFLLLDEPTNHLDLRAKDVLLESLEKYTGTVVFVSHDRYFIDKLATRVFEIGNGEVQVFPGNYEDYLWRKEGKQIDLTLPDLQPSLSHYPPPTTHNPNAKRLNPIKLKQMQERCQELELRVADLETEIAGYETELTNFVSAEEAMRVSNLLDQRRSELSKACFSAARHVEHVVAGVRFGSENIGPGNISDVDKIHRLLAVAENNRRLSRLQSFHPADQHFRVASMDIHSVAIDVEIPECDVIKPVHIIECTKQAFVEGFRSAVERPVAVRVVPLGRRKLFSHSVDRSR